MKLEKEIIIQVEKLLDGKLNREEIADWASKKNNNPIETDLDVETIKLLDFLMGIDLKDSPSEYLHTDEEIIQWLEKLKSQIN